jgi:hypothetical protein
MLSCALMYIFVNFFLFFNFAVDCSICINVLEQPSLIVRTDCKHAFHKVCLDMWMAEKSKYVKAVFCGIPVFNPKTIRRRGRKLPQRQMMVPAWPLCKTAMWFPQLEVVGTYEPEGTTNTAPNVEVIDITSDDENDVDMEQAEAEEPGLQSVVEQLDSMNIQSGAAEPGLQSVVEQLDSMNIQSGAAEPEDNVPIDNPPALNNFGATICEC